MAERIGSILDDYRELTVAMFEKLACLGSSKTEIMTIFRKTGTEMDRWCRENYDGLPFNTVYEMVRQAGYRQFLDIVEELGYRGNPTALGIINQALDAHAKESVTKIVFGGSVEKETEEDAMDEESE